MSVPWVDEGTLIAAGKTLEYRCFGSNPSDKPTFVLLHEGLGCAELWRDFPSKLVEATGSGVFAYSRAGYGHSDEADLPRPLNYMSMEAIDSLPEVLDAIDATSVVLLGHSDGATIAAIHAGRVADPRVKGIVLLAPHFFTEAIGLAEIAKASEDYGNRDLRDRLGKYHKNPDNAFFGWNDSWLNPDFKQWNVVDVLDTIRVPVLAIQGEDDPYGTLEQIKIVRQRVRLSVVTTLVLAQCRHAPHLEHSKNVIEAIANFCVNLPGDTASPTNSQSTLTMYPLPTHAYVPGVTERHPENAFDELKNSVSTGQNPSQLEQSDAFCAGLQFFEAGFYWETHELLEPVWMALPEGCEEKQFVQGLIQLANGFLKLRMHRPKAALRLATIVRGLIPADASSTVMTIETKTVLVWIDDLEKHAKLLL